MLAELAGNRAEAARLATEAAVLEARRMDLIRTLLAAEPKVARKRIADAAGLKEARLYQIRDGRR